MTEVGFLGKIFGAKAEKEARKKTIKIGTKESQLFVSEFRHGNRTWAYLISRYAQKKTEKNNIAIAVQITRPIAQHVVDYLENNKIEANFILIANQQDIKSTKELDDCDKEEWRAIVQDFREIVAKIRAEIGYAEFHLFFAAPAALVMALGAVFGNFGDTHVYNLARKENTYREVLRLPI